MPAFLNLIFFSAACVVVYAVFLVVWNILLRVFRTRRTFWQHVASLPVFIALLASWFVWQSRPATVFKNCFGFAPPADVTALQSSQWFLGDTGIVHLHFRANPSTIQRLADRGLAPSYFDIRSHGNDDPPEWWQPRRDGAKVFFRQGSGDQFATEEEYLVYDPASSEVWYRFVGID